VAFFKKLVSLERVTLLFALSLVFELDFAWLLGGFRVLQQAFLDQNMIWLLLLRPFKRAPI